MGLSTGQTCGNVRSFSDDWAQEDLLMHDDTKWSGSQTKSLDPLAGEDEVENREDALFLQDLCLWRSKDERHANDALGSVEQARIELMLSNSRKHVDGLIAWLNLETEVIVCLRDAPRDGDTASSRIDATNETSRSRAWHKASDHFASAQRRFISAIRSQVSLPDTPLGYW